MPMEPVATPVRFNCSVRAGTPVESWTAMSRWDETR